jgi:hypothetical protein
MFLSDKLFGRKDCCLERRGNEEGSERAIGLLRGKTASGRRFDISRGCRQALVASRYFSVLWMNGRTGAIFRKPEHTQRTEAEVDQEWSEECRKDGLGLYDGRGLLAFTAEMFLRGMGCDPIYI